MSAEVWGLVLIAALGHALWNFAARKIAGDMAVLWLSFALGTLVLLPLCAYAWWQGPPPVFIWQGVACLLATGIFHGIYFALLARSYEHGEISLVYPIARGSGVGLTALVAWLALGEEISPLGAGGIALILVGILSLGSSALQHQTRDLQLALGVGTTIVCYSLVDKLGVGHMRPIYYITGMWTIATLMRAPFVLRRYGRSLGEKIRTFPGSIALIGLGSLGTYLLILFAYTKGPVSYIVPARESSVVLGALLGFLFLKEPFTRYKMIGILAIASGLVLIKVG